MPAQLSVFTPGPTAYTLKQFETCRCSLIHVFQAITKQRKKILQKQQDDIGYLSRHLDHVISFTKWATARRGCAALLHRKRLVSPRVIICPLHCICMNGEHVPSVTHKRLFQKIINGSPSVADSVSDWKPPPGKLQYLSCTTEHCTVPVSILLLGLKH